MHSSRMSGYVPGLDSALEEVQAEIGARNTTLQFQGNGENVGTKGGIETINFTGSGAAVTNPAAGLLVIEVSGDLTTDIPANSVFLAPHFFANNGGAAAAVVLDFYRYYLESDF